MWVISALGAWSQEDGEFKVSLSYTVDLRLSYRRSCFKTPKAKSLNQEHLALTAKNITLDPILLWPQQPSFLCGTAFCLYVLQLVQNP